MNTLACTVSQKSLTEISSFKIWNERKLDKYMEEKAGEGWFAIPRYKTSLSTWIPNIYTLACTVSQKSLTKNFIIQSMERKKIGQIQGRISSRRLVRNPTIQYLIINPHTKYEYSSLHSFTEIFDEKFHNSKHGKKENWTNTGKNKQEKAGSQSHDTIHHYQLAHQIWLL